MAIYKKAFGKVSDIVSGLSWKSLPNCASSYRSANDRGYSDYRTRDKCHNNILEIGYLMSVLSDSEKEELKGFTAKDLDRTLESSGLGQAMQVFQEAKATKPKGRWGSRI